MICVQNLRPGQTFDFYSSTGLTIKIPNESGKNKYIIECYTKGESDYRPLHGYYLIPEKDWIDFPKDTFIALPSDTCKVNFQVKIPDKPKYYNQAFELPINVTQTSLSEEQGYIDFALAVTIKYYIETQAKPLPEVNPFGKIGLAPTNIFLKNAEPGKQHVVSFNIYNNDTTEHTYRVFPYIPSRGDTINVELDIPASGNSCWSEDKEWIKPKQRKFLWFFNKGSRIKIKSNQAKECKIEIQIPSEAKLPDIAYLPGGFAYKPRSWEIIIMVESDSGNRRFLRLLAFPPSL